MHPNRINSESSVIDEISFALIIGLLITLTLSAYNLNSLCIIGLVICTLLKRNTVNGFKTAWKMPFFRACILLFIIHALGSLYAADLKESFKVTEMWLALIAIPWIMCSEKLVKAMQWKRIMFSFCVFLFFISLYCLFVSSYRCFVTNDIQHLFYHDLVSPVSPHAIYFSVLVVAAILFLAGQREAEVFRDRTYLYYFLTGYFVLFLVLLSSKLILSIVLFYFLYKMVKSRNRQIKWPLYITGAALLLGLIVFTNNPVKKRFRDIMQVRTSKITTNNQQAGDFNGLEFRMIQWRLVAEILQEEKRWWIGVSPGDAQEMLNNKYREYNFYQGNPATGDRGFLGYNTHNQFLQCLLQSGITGLVALLYLCYALIRMASKADLPELWILTILLLAFFFTESVLQNQKGIVSFTFFPLFLYYSKWSRANYKSSFE